MKNAVELEQHRIERYINFATLYQIEESQFDTFVGLYEIDDLTSFYAYRSYRKGKAGV